MMSTPSMDQRAMTKIGVFYDGNYFLHISNYYLFKHSRAARISIRGLHEFIENQVATLEAYDLRLCKVVDSHYFRGRLSAYDAREANKLFAERQFDDILMNEGVTTHYLPIRNRRGRREDKGIDVWMALEAYELALYKQYNILVLIASDGDYLPLVRKLNSRGIKVMVLCWEFDFVDDYGVQRETRSSKELLLESTYVVYMHEAIDNKNGTSEKLVAGLFVPNEVSAPREPQNREGETLGEEQQSIIVDLKSGYGFIQYPPNNLFFHASDVADGEFEHLRRGDKVAFQVGTNDKGLCARNVRLLLDDDEGYDDFDYSPAKNQPKPDEEAY